MNLGHSDVQIVQNNFNFDKFYVTNSLLKCLIFFFRYDRIRCSLNK